MMRRSSWLALLGILVLAAVAAASALLLLRTTSRHLLVQRAVAMGALPAATPWRSSGIPYGAAASLESEPANLPRSLDALQQGGYLWLRQRFPWNDIEPQRGIYQWDRYDAIVDAATQRGLRIIAILDTSPAWARSSAVVTAPPDDMDDYGRFVAAFVAHYRDHIGHIQIWDQPNVAPNWGDYWASPAEYVAMLKAAYPLAKAANPEVVVLGGGLAPTVADDQQNLNDVTFLRRMYAFGARGLFDVLAAKPYGFWTGPDDRRVDASVLNFSRVILLREIMVKNGDGARPIWAVEMGWNALPQDWQGRPSPWGTDTERVQARRTVDALQRARSEWPWMDVMVINGLRFPNAPADDPIHGFALVDEQTFSPRLTYSEVQAYTGEPFVAYPGRYTADTAAATYSAHWIVSGPGMACLYCRMGLTGADVTFRFNGTGVAVHAQAGSGAGRLQVWLDGEPLARLPRAAPGVNTVELARQSDSGMVAVVLAHDLPGGEHTLRLQVAGGLDGGTVIVGGFEVVRQASFLRYYATLALLILVVVFCIAGIAVLMPRLPWQWWLDVVDRLPLAAQLGLLAASLVLYYVAPWLPIAAVGALAFGALAIARLDLALLLTVVTVPFYLYPRPIGGQVFSLPEVLTIVCFGAYLVRGLGLRRWGWDGAFRLPVVLFLGVGVLSLAAAVDVRLGLRELRTAIAEPALFYIVAVAAFDRSERTLGRRALVWALVLASAAAALLALGQYLFTAHVITAEGVRRALGPYLSPNNLGLLLERALPLALALVVHSAAAGLPDKGLRSLTARLRTAPAAQLGVVLLAAACSLLMLAVLFLTYSVGAWLGALAGVLVFAGLRGRRVFAAVVVAVILATVLMLPVLRVERVASHLGLSGQTTTSIRLDLWQSTLAMIEDQPLAGVGPDGFLDAYRGIYIRPAALREPNLSHPHNLILEWWVFLGILGLPLLLWLLGAFLVQARRSLSKLAPRDAVLVQGALAAMAAAVTHGLVDRFYFGAPDLAFIFFSLLLISELGRYTPRPGSGD